MNMMNNIKISLLAIFLFLFLGSLSAQTYQYHKPDKPMKYWSDKQISEFWQNQRRLALKKPTGAADRREGIMNGNQIRTIFYNYGSVGRPNTEPSIEWPKESGHGYAYEFGPIIVAEVVDIYGDTIHIASEALIDGGDTAPNGKVWGWQPLPQYLNTTSETPAMSNNPASWPRTQNTTNPFFNPDNTGPDDMFMWPGLDGLGTLSADLESFWVMDDRDNNEFEYYPFVDDSSRRGLGLELRCRLLQFSAALAEDIIFYIITIKNVSDKRLEKVVAGMFGDPHIGGPGDFSDDRAGFDSATNMVYAWDSDGSGNDYSIPWEDLGWLGFKFLESPKDSNGVELGLTSMSAPLYASSFGTPAYDDVMWDQLIPGKFTDIEQDQDNVFLFGTGFFPLDPGESVQFSIAILMGKGLDDLNSNAQIAQDIYELDYKFTKAPVSPQVTVVPGDGKVSLYWDTRSERSFDDFFGTYDFEGYKIYRSTDKINWGEPITDVNGAIKYYKPLAQFDIDNDVSGFYPFQQLGTNFYLGDNTGLQHTFVDESVINGVTYYYAVTAYDSGYITLGIQPAESGREPGVNLVSAKPAARAAGYENAFTEIEHTEGYATGNLEAHILDPMLIYDNDVFDYNIFFADTSSKGKTFFVYYLDEMTEDTIYVLENIANMEGEPNLFDGLIFNVTDEPTIKVVDSLSGWTEQSVCTFEPLISLFPSGGYRLPRDLELRFYNTIVDTSVIVPPFRAVNFDIWNVTENEKLDFIFFDYDNNDSVSVGDIVVPIEYVNNTPRGTWQIEFLAPAKGDTIEPASGDIVRISLAKPFELIDKYHLSVTPPQLDEVEAKKDFMENVAVVPNPYIVSSSFEVPPATVFSQGRGERRIDFIGLPPNCTIRIYNVSGELVDIVYHDTNDIFNDRESWDLLSKEGLEISYGIYIYHIDAGEYGEKIGKFAIIK